jgi:hypothetical protein
MTEVQSWRIRTTLWSIVEFGRQRFAGFAPQNSNAYNKTPLKIISLQQRKMEPKKFGERMNFR